MMASPLKTVAAGVGGACALGVRDLSVNFGGLQAVAGVGFEAAAGRITWDGQDLLAMEVEERARAGLFLSFQAPPEIPGVKNNLFIRTAVNAVREARGERPLDAFDFLGDARAAAGRGRARRGSRSRRWHRHLPASASAPRRGR